MRRLLILLLALTASACGGGGGGSTPPASAPDSPPAEELPEPNFEPAPVSDISPLPSADAPVRPAPPPELRLATATDDGECQPAQPITGITASSSGDENDNNTAGKAVDGDPSSRWESAWSDIADPDDAWLQFDFGTKTAIGSMELYWENAYADEYAIYISDDAEDWYQVRYITVGKGNTETFFNLNIDVRYVRLQGIRRHTHYGYSLFEAEFKTPGCGNSMPILDTSYVPYPVDGRGRQPLPAPAEPIESIRFTLADGTLVTRFGMVGRSRHARERGEEWNEYGFGRNDTVDGQGNPLDKGPGAHLNFVANYFKNRTWGVEFIDNSNVAGVTEPRIIVNQYFQQAQKGGGHSFVRRFDDPNVTGFGWMSPGDLLDDSTYLSDGAPCPVVPKPANNELLNPDSGFHGIIGANDGCSVVFDTYPGHSALAENADGVLVPNGDNVPARPLKQGDIIEFTSSFFSTREAMDAIGDDGAVRYYTNELTYVMGEGLRPWYGQEPRLMNEPLPRYALQGGLGSVSYDYADNASFIFQQPHNNVGMRNIQRFMEGRRWLHTNLWSGAHNEAGNDRNDAGRELQGQHFNQSTCVSCHINNGRSVAPVVANQRLDTMVVRVGAESNPANGLYLPHPVYGQSLQMNARSTTSGTSENWGNAAYVAGFDSHDVILADGTVVTLRKPTIAFEGPSPASYSLRAAQPLIGMGLLEAIADDTILARVRGTPDEDGVLGTANYAYDPESGEVRLGRYGWKAGKVSLRHQVANAALLDMSVTSSLYPNRDCLAGPKYCDPASGTEAGLPDDALQLMADYLQLLAVPAQRSQVSGFPQGVSPLPYLDVDPNKVTQGEQVFNDIRCNACHVSEIQTSARSRFAEVRNQTIRPYTDLLLHDMGEGLADDFAEGLASGRMWRTPALWGIGYTKYVAGDIPVGYLHDGRARTLTEAIIWHGGEAEVIKNRFINLSSKHREALLAFLGSL
ncbi:carbohydrate binding module family 32 domain-containing protein [Alcanivorax balearicus MACL04]|uniref:Carbohydrate binding module family 32 domain-containing protein n=1 Tax=Alloalcanivorax balearicus MACL04 TaxID=1177182 RepID=A0ABT2QWV3_9GAMM|nr:di-heme oxidoredictase family protein [Alloalcanivorax balearicus]MCU5782001.1 carbohydrate binding module family 32 domain-containing protein [Alloalcanivorax balearicus MACL04]